MLDLTAVAAFLKAAELRSFTRAAEALGTTQSMVSTRIRRLEQALGRSLLQRHPRLVRLTEDGARFLAPAEALIAAHGQALAVLDRPPERLTLGLSEQAVGASIAPMLSRLAARVPHVVIDLRIAPSAALDEAFAQGALDAVVVLRLAGGRGGEVLRKDRFGWYAAPDLSHPRQGPLPLISLTSDCRLRRHAIATLDRAGLSWREAFIGGGMAAVLAALGGGLGVAPLAAGLAPPDAKEIGPAWGLPALGRAEVVLRSNVSGAGAAALLRELAAAYREPPQPFGNSSPISR